MGGEKGIDQGLTCRDFEQFDRWSDMKKLIAISFHVDPSITPWQGKEEAENGKNATSGDEGMPLNGAFQKPGWYYVYMVPPPSAINPGIFQ